ncbi:hypothetical protein ACS5PU_01295 [Pedobacter sp. GSP4]|uniref:hypothetical protein n=1 Tax=Pedobacter sp. GSP4 TaxID=3453716 RepID=UPI003EE8E801
MKKLELSKFGVQEMDAREVQGIDGGIWPNPILYGWGKIKEAFLEGFNDGSGSNCSK